MSGEVEFLDRIRHAMRAATAPFPAASLPRTRDPEAEAESIRHEVLSRWPALLSQFTEELERLEGKVYRVPTKAEAILTLVSLVREWSAKSAVTCSPEVLYGLQVEEGLRSAGLEVEAGGSAERMEEAERLVKRRSAAAADVGVTGVDFAVAETGSLVLISGKGRPRAVSLLPPRHVAIFGKGQLVPTIESLGVFFELLHREPDRSMSGASITFITGPSRTADIELTLTRGVHGPKEVHAIFVEEL